jgi:hypothetical protein
VREYVSPPLKDSDGKRSSVELVATDLLRDPHKSLAVAADKRWCELREEALSEMLVADIEYPPCRSLASIVKTYPQRMSTHGMSLLYLVCPASGHAV